MTAPKRSARGANATGVLTSREPSTNFRRISGTFSPLSPNFGVSFSDRIDMPEPDFPLPVIQLDFDADIPWVLGKKNSYIDE